MVERDSKEGASLSEEAHCGGSQGRARELLYWGPWVMNGRLWRRESIFVGAPMGNMEWDRLLGTFRYG